MDEMEKLIYLASPYSHKKISIMNLRYRIIEAAHAALILKGNIIFSPISHSHPVAQEFELPRTFKFWERIDHRFLAACDEVWVLGLNGWEESHGVASELSLAEEKRITHRILKPNDIFDEDHWIQMWLYHDKLVDDYYNLAQVKEI